MRIKTTPPLRAPTRPDNASDAKDPSIASSASPGERIQDPSARRTEPRDDPDLLSLMNTAMSTVNFDADSLKETLAKNQRAKAQTVDWRLVAAAAILVILIFMIDLVLQLV